MICGGGGGIPVVSRPDGSVIGVEAVIDKDYAGALLAEELQADAFLILTDVDAVYAGWGTPAARAIRRASPEAIETLSLAAGSTGPKVEAACAFVPATHRIAAIGPLDAAAEMLRGEAGTTVAEVARAIEWAVPVSKLAE